MKKTILVVIGSIVFSRVHTSAQVLPVSDSIAAQVESGILAGDSLSDPASFALPQRYEYVPAEETPELVNDRLSCLEHTIPLTYNNSVHGFINFFTIRNREYTRLMLRRKDLYFPLFEKYLLKYNLPDELKYLSIIESGLNPRAISRANAVGLWQFMSFTGRYYGLHNDGYIDDRMDPEKSTEAACRYMKQLYTMFGNWELALAAYNSGPGTVKRAIRRSGYKKTFWEIYKHLPRETRSYVPQYVAIIYAMAYAEEHNMSEIAREEFIPHDTLIVKKFLHLETLAALTGTCTEELHLLNPSLRQNVIPDNGKKFILKMPAAAKVRLGQNRMAILDSATRTGRKAAELIAKTSAGSVYRREPVIYKVKYGDVLGLIAQRYHVRLNDLRKWNNLSGNLIRAGQNLTIWVVPSTKSLQKTTAAQTAPVKETVASKAHSTQESNHR